MGAASEKLWSLTAHNGGVRAADLLDALADPDLIGDPNPRTPILVRDSIFALERLWGSEQFHDRLTILRDPLPLFEYARAAGDDHGFPSLERRTMDATDTDDILAVLREVGSTIREQTELIVGGSAALILAALIIHHTQDIDVVDEVPASIRNDHALLEAIKARFPLQLTHFQSHYLPDGWKSRTRSLGRFGNLSVRVIDVLDILVGKLFSKRDKDYVHLAEAWRVIDRASLRERITHSTANLRADPSSDSAAKHNWYVLTGEAELP